MATHASVLAWRISGTEKPGGLPSMGLHRVRHDRSESSSSSSKLTWLAQSHTPKYQSQELRIDFLTQNLVLFSIMLH